MNILVVDCSVKKNKQFLEKKYQIQKNQKTRLKNLKNAKWRKIEKNLKNLKKCQTEKKIDKMDKIESLKKITKNFSFEFYSSNIDFWREKFKYFQVKILLYK